MEILARLILGKDDYVFDWLEDKKTYILQSYNRSCKS